MAMIPTRPTHQQPEITGGHPAIFTICSRNYLPQAKVLIDSVRRVMPEYPVSVFLADEAGDELTVLSSFAGAPVIPGADLGIPTYHDMAMRYDIVEFNTALKPFAFSWLFGRGAPAAIYLDPDIQLFAPLSEVCARLDAGASAVITPHITKPLPPGCDPTDIKLIRTGIYNLGFAAVANTPEARRFVDWWASKMPTDCRRALDAGLFVDQKYVDLMPAFLPGTSILRHDGYNVAYWNLAHRPLARDREDGWRAADDPLVFMHFSGIRPDDPALVSVHQDRALAADPGEGAALFDAYRRAVKSARQELEATGADLSYAYGRFITGEEITAPIRQVYARAMPPSRAGREEIFDPGHGAYLRGVTGVSHGAANLISPVMADLWMRKPHLQAAFNIREQAEAEAYALWFAETGHREWNISRAFIPASVWELRKERRSLRARLAVLTFRGIELTKKTAFLYPKPVRRAAVRATRRYMPRLARRMKA